MEHTELERIVLGALNKLYARDRILLENDSAEWTVAHRLAVYLEDALPGWNVDCEYNRQGSGKDVKRLTSAVGVRPDIVVHHRGLVERSHNLLAIELKKSSTEVDASKAQEYTATPTYERRYQYLYGLTLVLPKAELGWQAELKWFRDGSALP